MQAWSDGATNHGWAWLQADDNSWQFDSAETGNPPVLTVKYFVVTDPTISVSGTPLSEFSSEPGAPSGEQSYSVSGSNLTEDIVVTAPTDFEVSLSSTTGFGASVTLTQSGGSVASTPVFVRMNAASEGTPSGDITHVSAGATTVNVAVSGSVVAIPDEWVAYNDMNTLGGAANPTNVTDFEYSESGSLVDYGSGVVLPVTVIGSTSDTLLRYPDGGPVTNAASDAYAAFDGIADLTGTDQLQTGQSATLTFTGLDPSETYAVTLSANRDNPLYDGNRYAQVTIDGVDASAPASSSGVVVNSDTSVSFSIGDNSTNGYVARWVNINPGADGEFTITSVWDESQGVDSAGTGTNTRGYAMAAFRLETYSAVDTTDPVVVLTTPADGAVYDAG